MYVLLIIINYAEEIPQTQTNNSTDFNNINDIIIDTSEFNQRSNFIDTQITGKNCILLFVQ